MKSLIKTSALAIGLAAALGATAAEAQLRVMLPINPGVALMAGAPETPTVPDEPGLADWGILASNLPSAGLGLEYSFDFSSLLTTDPADFDLGDLTWAGSLPGWLEIDHETGFVSGTPKSLDEEALTISASHIEEGHRSQSFTLSVGGVELEATHISIGTFQTCAIVTGGAAKCWGNASNGTLGNGETSGEFPIPVDVAGLSSGVTAISVSVSHACAVHHGAAKCWGGGAYGKLGNGSTASSLVPVNVAGLTSGVTAISVNSDHSCAIQSGVARCWGRGRYGRLGNNSEADRSMPVAVAGLTSGVTSISAGNAHTCAVHNGAAKCWGRGISNQLGNGSSSDALTPVTATGLSANVSKVVVGDSNSCAIYSGTAWCWGANNQFGLIGDGSTFVRATPALVSGMSSGVSDITFGSYHGCVVQNGAAKCWGLGTSGNVGDGESAGSNPTPRQVLGLTSGVTQVSGGNSASCAIHNGVAKCWGNNSYQQLGVRTDPNTAVPSAVMTSPSH